MNHQNSVLLEGILITDPEVAAVTKDGDSRLIKFVLASDRFYMGKDGNKVQETIFMPVQCWGALGEGCLSLMRKGMTARCVGRLQPCSWKSKRTGEKKSSMEIVCRHLEFQTKGGANDGKIQEIGVIDDKNHEADLLCESVVLYEF